MTEDDKFDKATKYDTYYSMSCLNSLISTTLNLPSVNVPVLSNAIASILANVSMSIPLLTKTPFLAAAVMPHTIGIGTDITRAQGQAMRRTTNARIPQECS